MWFKVLLFVVCLLGISQQSEFNFKTTVTCGINAETWCFMITYYESSGIRAYTNHHCLTGQNSETVGASIRIRGPAAVPIYIKIRHNCTSDGKEKDAYKIYGHIYPEDADYPLEHEWNFS